MNYGLQFEKAALLEKADKEKKIIIMERFNFQVIEKKWQKKLLSKKRKSR